MNSSAPDAMIARLQMLQSLREEKEGNFQMLFSPKKNGLDSLFKEARVFKGGGWRQTNPLKMGKKAPVMFGSAKTDPVRFKWGFGAGLLKDEFAFFEAYKSPIPKRRKLLAKRPFF